MALDLKQKLAIRIAVNEQLKLGVPRDDLVEEICRLRIQVAELEKPIATWVGCFTRMQWDDEKLPIQN